ncbi:hypothetical protein [Flavobacterium phage FL-1]|nr:hypothetical protein [Flavobacterium phage FL-1]
MKKFKKQVREFKTIIESLCLVWDNPKYITISVLLQNLGFESCEKSLEEEKAKCEKIIKSLRLMADFDKNCHVSNYVFQEIDSLYMGFVICSDNY